MQLNRLLLIGMFVWCALPLQATEVVLWLKGTYTPFLANERLAAHKGLSPLMGAIAWHSGWIVGLYTWGVGQKQVERGAVQQQAGPAEVAAPVAVPIEAVPGRVKITWSDNDATTELVRTLFHEAGEGDIQPTISLIHPFFVAITDKDAEKLSWLLNKIIDGDIPQKTGDFLISGSKKFLKLVAASREQCGPGKRYPAWVTDQILAAYYYAVQFKPQVNGGAVDMVAWMNAVLERYMHALGVADYAPAQYALSAEASQECPAVIDEAILVKNLYKKLNVGDVPPFANYKNFAYRGAHHRGTCVETMIHNFFNVLLYDAIKQRYTLNLLPVKIKEHAHERLLAYYANERNALVVHTDAQDVHDAWAKIMSGLPGADKAIQPHEIEYAHVDSKGSFELASTKRNVLLVINTLLGTRAKSFEDLSELLSTAGRRVTLRSLVDKEGFELSINQKRLARFVIDQGHAQTEPINQCVKVDFNVVCDATVAGQSLERLQDILLMHTGANITEQEARYLMYGAGKNDFDWLVKLANIFCPPAHEDVLFASVADTLFDLSRDAWWRLNLSYLFINVPIIGSKQIDALLVRVIEYSLTDDALFLIERSANVNAKNNNGDSALMLAIEKKLDVVALALIAKGADVKAKNRRGVSVLARAIENKLSVVALALIAKGAPVGPGVLLRARNGKLSDVESALIAKGADVADAKDSDDSAMLMISIEKSRTADALALIEKGVDVNAMDMSGVSVLVQAIGKKLSDVALKLIEKGADVHARDRRGISTLLSAIRSGLSDVALAFIAKGVHVGPGVLLRARMQGLSDVVTALVAKGADSADAKDADDAFMLIVSIRLEHSDDALALIEKGVDVNTWVGDEDIPVLLFAIRMELPAVALVLIEKGANVDAKDNMNVSVLIRAIQCQYSDIAMALIEKGAHVDVEDNLYIPALIYAIENKHVAVVRALIAKGAYVSEIALDRAKKDGNAEIIALIERALAQKASQPGSPQPQAVPA